MFSLLHRLLLLFPSSLQYEFQVGILASEKVSVSNLPLRVNSRLLNLAFLCLLFCSLCMRNCLRITNSKHWISHTMNKQVSSSWRKHVVHFGHWWEIAFSQMLPRNKKCTVTSNYCMTSWRTPSDIYKYRRCEFAAHYDARTVHTLCACFTPNKIINSLCSELSESQQCNYT